MEKSASEKKKALVTGASEGIGLEFAKRLAKEGYRVTLVARGEDKLKSALQNLEGDHDFMTADLSTEAGQKKVRDELNKTHFHLLINNAGVGTVGGFTEVAIEKQLAMIRLNCEAVTFLSHAYLDKARSGDALINVSSTLAFLPMPGIGLYCATKAFVTSLSESLWYENKDRGVYVMGLCPGITSTNFQVNAGGRKEDLPANMAQTPEELVEVALRALQARKEPTVISGLKNFVFASITRMIPRKATVAMMGKMGSRREGASH